MNELVRPPDTEICEIESQLIQHPQVAECRVLRAVGPAGQSRYIGYVVLTHYLPPHALAKSLNSVLPDGVNDLSYVPVTAIPRDSEGRCNDADLEHTPCIDDDLCRKLENDLHAVPGIDDAAVVVQELANRTKRFHVSDFLGRPEKMLEPEPVLSSVGAGTSSSLAPQALSEGGALSFGPDIPRTLPDGLARAISQSGSTGLTYFDSSGGESFQSYFELSQSAEKILAGLRRKGLKPKDRVILQIDNCREFINAYWGCLLGGFVPVPVAVADDYTIRTGTVNRLLQAWELLDQPLVLTSSNLRSVLRELNKTIVGQGMEIVSTEDCAIETGGDREWHSPDEHDLAVLLLTSGSTGIPKAVMLSHANIVAMAEGTIRMNHFDADEVALNWMPLDHVGAIIFLHTMCVHLGCHQIHCPKEIVLADVTRWFDWIDRFRATISWAPNFAFRLVVDKLGDRSDHAWDLSSMRFLVNAGEMIVTRVARTFLECLGRFGLPTDAIRPAFGMSETCSGITWSDAFSLESTTDNTTFVGLGRPIPGASLRVVDGENQLLREGDVGRFQVCGPSVSVGYYKNEIASSEAVTSDGWFDTGDLGVIRDGILTLTGRESESIIIRGTNYDAHEIEAAVEEEQGIVASYTAACSILDSDTGSEELAVFFSPTEFGDAFLVDLIGRIRSRVARTIGLAPYSLVPIDQAAVIKTAIGKIQRTTLRKQLLQGKFDDTLKRVDLLLGGQNTLPEWFYKEQWLPKEILQRNPRPPCGAWLVFSECGEFSATVINDLSEHCDVFVVRPGTKFAQIGARDFELNCSEAGDYDKLFDLLESSGHRVENMVHTWTYQAYREIRGLTDLARSDIKGWQSILNVSQALSKRRELPQNVNLFVVTSHTNLVSSSDDMAFENAPLIGALATLRREMPWLNCRHIDFESGPPSLDLRGVREEIFSGSSDTDVSYRAGTRFTRTLGRVELTNDHAAIVDGGIYLVTGGLGGIGIELSRLLLEQYSARLLIVGREELTSEAGVGSAKHEAYERLRAISADVLYTSADVRDFTALDKAVTAAEARWGGQLNGIFHLAGVFDGLTSLASEKADAQSASFDSKVFGTWQTAALLVGRPDTQFVCFGSVSGVLGHANMGRYAAASSFQHRFSQFLREKKGYKSQCISWSVWNGVGLSRGLSADDSQALSGLGYYSLSLREALNSLLIVLQCEPVDVLVGLDGSAPSMRRIISPERIETQKLAAYVVGESVETVRRDVDSDAAFDGFGNVVECELAFVEHLPRDDAGTVNYRALEAGYLTGAESGGRPAGNLEKLLSSIVRELLRLPSSVVYNNDLPLTSLGLDSLRAAELKSRVEAETKISVSLGVLLRGDSTREIAEWISKETAKQLGGSDEIASEPPTVDAPFEIYKL